MNISYEIKREIWDDDHGVYWEVGPDRDALGLVEIRKRDETSSIIERMTIPQECTEYLADAIVNCAKEMKGGD